MTTKSLEEKYGLKLTGLKAACSATRELPEIRKDYPGVTIRIWYDKENGAVLQEQIAGPDWTTFHADQAIFVIRTSVPMTMWQIAEYINAAVQEPCPKKHLFGRSTSTP